MRDDPNMARRLEQGRKEVEESKSKLLENANQYSEIYKQEILEGTRKRQLLLTEGAKRGLTEAEVLKDFGKFIPSNKTPIMNFLYFFMRDGDHPDWLGIQKKLFNQYGHTDSNPSSSEVKKVVEHVSQSVTEDELDQIFGLMVHEDEKYTNVQEPAEMDTFIYGKMTHPTYQKIKKLKTLSTSENENEAFLAYRLCMKLCKHYGLEFDKVGTYN